MSFISNLFKKKPGGSAIGNLLRNVSASTIGVAINGPAPTQMDVDVKQLSDSDFALKYGTNKQGVPVAGYPTATQQANAATAGLPAPPSKMTLFFQHKWVKIAGIIIGCLLVVGLVYRFVIKGKGKNRRY